MTNVRSVSYGGGVQSTALLVLAAQKRIDFDLFLFANVGDDSEHPESLRYVREIAAPFAEEHGIELVALQRRPAKGLFGGRVQTLWELMTHPDSRSVPIPVRMANGAPGSRACTTNFKIGVITKELRRRGATVDNPATVALGISVDEIERAKPGIDQRNPYQTRVYPLLDLGLHRSDCKRIIADAGLPVPGKSACFFCPFHNDHAWLAQSRHEPDLFAKSVQLEGMLNAKRTRHGQSAVYLTRHGRPLIEVVAAQQNQGVLDGLDSCDSGYCFT